MGEGAWGPPGCAPPPPVPPALGGMGTHTALGWVCWGSTGWAVTLLQPIPPWDEPPVPKPGQRRYLGSSSASLPADFR